MTVIKNTLNNMRKNHSNSWSSRRCHQIPSPIVRPKLASRSHELLIFIRDVLFEFQLKFWNTASIGIPVRSLL